jgi:transposase
LPKTSRNWRAYGKIYLERATIAARIARAIACEDLPGLPLFCALSARMGVADCTAGAELLARLPPCEILHGDKGYDSDAIRRQVEDGGAMPNIPPKANRKWKNCFSPFLYRNRNAIERMFCRLKDFRRVATRYDRNAVNFLAAEVAATKTTLTRTQESFGLTPETLAADAAYGFSRSNSTK